MSRLEHYFNFPLIALQGQPKDRTPSPLKTLELCLALGIRNAGLGYFKTAGEEKFMEILTDQCRHRSNEFSDLNQVSWQARCYLVGCAIANVDSTLTKSEIIKSMKAVDIDRFQQAPYIRMKASFLWKALDLARYEDDPAGNKRPSQGESITWNEFRVLSAILSSKTNSRDFTFIGWQSIQARSCGFKDKPSFRKAKKIKDHLAPALTRQPIRRIVDKLELNRFFLKFHYSRGSRGGYSAYSFRHDTRENLAHDVIEWSLFTSGDQTKLNRMEDQKLCREMLLKPPLDLEE